MRLRIGEQECCRDQDDIWLVILYDASELSTESDTSNLPRSSIGRIDAECSQSALRTKVSLGA